MAVFECRTFKEVITSKAIKMGLTLMWLVFLWEVEIWTHIDFRDVCKEERPGEDSEKTVICKPRKEVWGEIKPADTLTVDSLASRTVENTFLWFMPLSLFYFVKYTDVNKSRKTIKRKKTIGMWSEKMRKIKDWKVQTHLCALKWNCVSHVLLFYFSLESFFF